MKYDPLDFMGPEDRERLSHMIAGVQVLDAAGGAPEDLVFLVRIISSLITKLNHESILVTTTSRT